MIIFKIICLIMVIVVIIIAILKCLVFLISLKADSEYMNLKKNNRTVSIKTIKKQESEITEDGAAASSIEQLIPYFKEHYSGILENRVWRKEALMYYWTNSYDPIEITDEKKYTASIIDTWIHQNIYINIVTQRCVGYMAKTEGYPWN